jgi:hypothetical protein
MRLVPAGVAFCHTFCATTAAAVGGRSRPVSSPTPRGGEGPSARWSGRPAPPVTATCAMLSTATAAMAGTALAKDSPLSDRAGTRNSSVACRWVWDRDAAAVSCGPPPRLNGRGRHGSLGPDGGGWRRRHPLEGTARR